MYSIISKVMFPITVLWLISVLIILCFISKQQRINILFCINHLNTNRKRMYILKKLLLKDNTISKFLLLLFGLFGSLFLVFAIVVNINGEITISVLLNSFLEGVGIAFIFSIIPFTFQLPSEILNEKKFSLKNDCQ